jgi:hypothetical protein
VYVSSHALTGLVLVLDSAGRFIRTIGSHGSGPGEFAFPTFIISANDTVVVGDARGALQVFDSAGAYVRTLPQLAAGNVDAIMLLEGVIVANQNVGSVDRFGYPLHVLGDGGTIARSFGADDRTVDPEFKLSQVRSLVKETDSTFWAAHVTQYRIELWSSSGSLLKSLVPSRDWFTPTTKDPAAYRLERPPGMLMGIHRDTRGNLQVLLQRARADWSRDDGITGGFSFSAWLQYVEQIVEVIDSAGGNLLGTVSNDSGVYFVRFLDDGRLFGFMTMDDGRHVPVLGRIRY